MMNYAELFGALGAGTVGGWSRSIFESVSITFTQAGKCALTVVGAGGSGAAGQSGTASTTGGNSAPWGRKWFTVAAGDVLVINIGAGGAKPSGNLRNGNAGNITTVTLNGATILSVEGGEGGVYASGTGTATAPAPVAAVTGADYWVKGIRAGSMQANSSASFGGGAAVDVLQSGKGRSNSISVSAGAGNGGSVGNDTGGPPFSWVAIAEFGLVITDGGSATSTNGAVGRGGSSGIAPGIFAGSAGNSGIKAGAGGGGCGGNDASSSGAGGDAYVYLVFSPGV